VFRAQNPYEAVLDSIQAAMHECERAIHACAEVQHSPGGHDLDDYLGYARQWLQTSGDLAAKWRDALQYHLDGSYPRTDF
jgi:hypothetical protein